MMTLVERAREADARLDGDDPAGPSDFYQRYLPLPLLVTSGRGSGSSLL
jgi:hypothetical protein